MYTQNYKMEVEVVLVLYVIQEDLLKQVIIKPQNSEDSLILLMLIS
jgi:hypothetical protein